MIKPALTIFYDGQCPLCCFEMDKLKARDTNNQIELFDIHDETFIEKTLALTNGQTLTKEQALHVIFGVHQGKLISGIDVNYWAWSIVGKRHWVLFLKIPVFRQLSKLCYLFFARYRKPISSFANKHFKLKDSNCSTGYCHDTRKTPDNRRK